MTANSFAKRGKNIPARPIKFSNDPLIEATNLVSFLNRDANFSAIAAPEECPMIPYGVIFSDESISPMSVVIFVKLDR